MAEKRYYWIKLHSNFMNSDAVDFLMSQKNGAEYVVLYQKLCFMTIQTNGELARMIGEILIPYNAEKIQRDCKHFSIDTVRVALELYKQLGLIYMQENGVLKIADYEKMVGSECGSAKRVRQFRENKRALQCNKNVTIEIEKEIEIDKDIYIKEKEIKEKVAIAPSLSQFVKPSLEDIQAYCNERGNYISAEAFFNHYESNGWRVGKTAMKDWQAAVRGWEVRHKAEHPEVYIDKPKNTARQEQQAKEEKEMLKMQKLKQDKQWLSLDKQKRVLTIAIVNGEDRQAELDEAVKALEQRKKEVLGL